MASYTINSAGGANYTTILAAYTAASAGDHLRVIGGGPYTDDLSGAAVYTKNIELVNETGTIISINMPSTKTFMVGQGSWIHGLNSGPGFAIKSTGATTPAVKCSNAVTAVVSLFEDCTFTADTASVAFQVDATVTQDVTCTRCTATTSGSNCIAFYVGVGLIGNTVNFTADSCTTNAYYGFILTGASVGTLTVKNCPSITGLNSGLYLANPNSTILVYNNKIVAGCDSGIRWVYAGAVTNTVHIYRNSIPSTVTAGFNCSTGYALTNFIIENNFMDKAIRTVAWNMTWDYNSYVTVTGTGGAHDVVVANTAAWLLTAYGIPQPGSPLLATGTITGLTTDIRGLPAVVSGHEDIGPYEYQGVTVRIIPTNYATYPLAFQAAVGGDEIRCVTAATYGGAGGYDLSLYSALNSISLTNTSGGVVQINAATYVTLGNAWTWSNLTINTGCGGVSDGVRLVAPQTGLTMTSCVITSALTLGAGSSLLFAFTGICGTITLTNCTITNSHATILIFLSTAFSGTATLTGCTLYGVGAYAGIRWYSNVTASCTFTCTNCNFVNCDSTRSLGFFEFTPGAASTLTLNACRCNISNSPYPFIYAIGATSTVTLTRCEVDNPSTGVLVSVPTASTLGTLNAHDNYAPVLAQKVGTGAITSFVGSNNAYSTTAVGTTGAGDVSGVTLILANLDANGVPRPGSPLLAAGTTSGLTTDIRGLPAVVNLHEDIGCFEYQGVKTWTINSAGGSNYTTLASAYLSWLTQSGDIFQVVGGGPYTENLTGTTVSTKSIELVNTTGTIITVNLTTGISVIGQGSWIHGLTSGPGFAFVYAVANYIISFNSAIAGAGTTSTMEDCTITGGYCVYVGCTITHNVAVNRCTFTSGATYRSVSILDGDSAHTVNATFTDCVTNAGAYGYYLQGAFAGSVTVLRGSSNSNTTAGVLCYTFVTPAVLSFKEVIFGGTTPIGFIWGNASTNTVYLYRNAVTAAGAAIITNSSGSANANLHVKNCYGQLMNIVAGWDCDYNSYVTLSSGVAGAHDVVVANTAAWKLDANGIPTYYDANHPSLNSPLIDVGTNTGVGTDYRGLPARSGKAEDIGPYEVQQRQLRDVRDPRHPAPGWQRRS